MIFSDFFAPHGKLHHICLKSKTDAFQLPRRTPPRDMLFFYGLKQRTSQVCGTVTSEGLGTNVICMKYS